MKRKFHKVGEVFTYYNKSEGKYVRLLVVDSCYRPVKFKNGVQSCHLCYFMRNIIDCATDREPISHESCRHFQRPDTNETMFIEVLECAVRYDLDGKVVLIFREGDEYTLWDGAHEVCSKSYYQDCTKPVGDGLYEFSDQDVERVMKLYEDEHHCNLHAVKRLLKRKVESKCR